MSINPEFFVEVLRNGVWAPPAEFVPEGRMDFPKSFTWMHRNGHLWLFIGDGALFPFVQGSPPVTAPSPLCDFIETRLTSAPDKSWETQFRPHWIPYQSLAVDLWDDPGSVLVESRVPQRHAIHFGQGAAEFPRTALMATGLEEAHLTEYWQSARAALQPINARQGEWPGKPTPRFPDAPIAVTWKASIRELIGDETADAFRALVQHGAASDLRVIAIWR